MDDAEAINRLKHGDISALEALVIKYQIRALRTAYLITRDKTMAEDAVQDAFLRVYDRAGQFDQGRPFEPWFLRIVINDALKAMRQRNRHISLSYRTNETDISITAIVPDLDPGLPEQTERNEVRRVVWEAIEQLSPSQRAVVVLKYYLGLTETQIAKDRGTHPGTVKKLLHRARQRLKLLLGTADIG